MVILHPDNETDKCLEIFNAKQWRLISTKGLGNREKEDWMQPAHFYFLHDFY